MTAHGCDTCNRGCDKCDGPGGVVTYANQVLMPLDGVVRCIDFCIHPLIAALNAGSTLHEDQAELLRPRADAGAHHAR